MQSGGTISEKTHFDFSLAKVLLTPHIVRSFLEDMLFTNNWGVVWGIALLSSLGLINKKTHKEGKLIFLSLILFFMLYLLIALTTENYVWIAGSGRASGLSRLLLHFYPLAALLIILANKDYHRSFPSVSNTAPK